MIFRASMVSDCLALVASIKLFQKIVTNSQKLRPRLADLLSDFFNYKKHFETLS